MRGENRRLVGLERPLGGFSLLKAAGALGTLGVLVAAGAWLARAEDAHTGHAEDLEQHEAILEELKEIEVRRAAREEIEAEREAERNATRRDLCASGELPREWCHRSGFRWRGE